MGRDCFGSALDIFGTCFFLVCFCEISKSLTFHSVSLSFSKDRLWCLFELAAFLQCNNGARPGLMIRPTFLGPCSIAAFLTTCIAMIPVNTVPVPFGDTSNLVPVLAVSVSVANYLAVVTFRRYFESVEVCSQKLRSTSFETVRSACCEKKHSNSQGRDMICDREVVKECINIWWGSQEAFEDFLHSEVIDAWALLSAFVLFE